MVMAWLSTTMSIAKGSPRAFARSEVAVKTRLLGADHPEVAEARQKYRAVKLMEHIQNVLPTLSREQIENITSLLQKEDQVLK
ncbi:hypothetical protein A5703_07480 [Mycobacterium sp. E188]|nr:hypothetical protein A5703_07480 [Mycobacterium sp. E188]OBH41084.1 hypothetical protein A5691_19345 [Mycobacterium sp. E183]